MDVFNIFLLLFVFIQTITFVTFVVYLIRYKKEVVKYKKMYEDTLSKFNSKDNIEDEFMDIYTRINNMEKTSKEIKDALELIMIKNRECIKQIEFLKYSAYDEKNTSSSFVLGLVDDNLNGILLNKIHSNNGSNIYAKKINNALVEERVSKEEQEVLDKIKNKK